MSALTDMLLTSVFIMGVIKLAGYFNLTDPTNLLIIRVGYSLSQALIIAFCLYLYSCIKRKADSAKMSVEEPSPPFTSEPPKTVEMTVQEYDNSKVTELLRQTIVSVLFVAFIHFKFDMVQPLIIQALIPIKSALMLPISQIHLFGKEAKGQLARPFKAPASVFSELSDSMSDEEGKIEELEKPCPGIIKAAETKKEK